jgi:hypothetical protein
MISNPRSSFTANSILNINTTSNNRAWSQFNSNTITTANLALKRSFDTMAGHRSFADVPVNRSFSGDVIMATSSPNPSFNMSFTQSFTQSFCSTGSGAMDVDSADETDADTDPGDADTNSPASSYPHPQSQTTKNRAIPVVKTVIIPTINPDADPTDTTGETLTEFHPFTRLPPKIRELVWSLDAPAPRTRFVELHTYSTIDHILRLRYIPPLPPLFSTSRESRAFSITHEGGEIIKFNVDDFNALFSFHGRKIGDGAKQEEASFYFNFTQDILWLGNRFTAACNTTETSRLSTLSSILPLPYLSRIKKLLITYSGLDSYAMIGPTMRPYASLETLYLAMWDKGSKMSVRRMLRLGVPDVGVAARKIEEFVRRTEDEETDDDEESEDVTSGRLAVRARRRILEVEVRLGD